MDHLNVFNAYKEKSMYHEDELTRTFLILVKNIPIVQKMFLDMIMEELDLTEAGVETKGELLIEEIRTQLSSNNEIFGSESIESRTLISVVISDERLSLEHTVENIERNARYDGVILCQPGLVFIIENKPFVDNIWLKQLNPSLMKVKDVKIHKKPCRLSWRDIITKINLLISNDMLSGSEKWIVEDFLEYVDVTYKWINPFTMFSVCKNDKFLLNKRCNLAMSKTVVNGHFAEVTYHKNWKYYIPSGKSTIKQIALDSTTSSVNWTIDLWLYVGDTMNSARESYGKLNLEKLRLLVDSGFTLEKNFHVSYRSSNLIWFTGGLSVEDYIKYWKKNHVNLKQIKRVEFEKSFNNFEQVGLILLSDQKDIASKILSKKYGNLNICPGFLIKYSWTKQEAIELDLAMKFEEDLAEKIKSAFEIFGETI